MLDGLGDIPQKPELSKLYFLKAIIIRNLPVGVQTLQLGAEQLRYLDLSWYFEYARASVFWPWTHNYAGHDIEGA